MHALHSFRQGRQGRLKRPPPGRPQRARRQPLAVDPPPGCDPDAIVLSFEVFRDFAGMRLDRFIQRRIPRLSRARAQRIIRDCAYTRGGRRRRPGEVVREGEIVLLVREGFEEPEVPTDFTVLHEDASVLAINKPAGLPVHRTATYHRNTLGYLLRERYGDDDFVPRIAHRLDRETSGVLLCARSAAAERAIKMGFQSRRWRKTYLAIVHGVPELRSGLVSRPMAPVSEGLHVMMELCPDGPVAETHYEIVQTRGAYSLVRLSPRTGRQHQLRLHMSAIGHPIVGDKLYGRDAEAPFMEHIETGMTPKLLAHLELPRHALHAHEVTFDHPDTLLEMTVTAPMPADMESFWAQRVAGA